MMNPLPSITLEVRDTSGVCTRDISSVSTHSWVGRVGQLKSVLNNSTVVPATVGGSLLGRELIHVQRVGVWFDYS